MRDGDVARPRLVVTVTGPESTGKTTLAVRLARRYETAWSAEYARAYLDARLAADPRAVLDAADVEPIARGQIAGEAAAEAAAGRAGRTPVVRDTDLVSTVVYAEHYYGACPAWIIDAARARRAALYLLCDVDAPWVPDAQRDRPHARAALHAAFAARLADFGCRVVPLRGTWDERFARATAAIDGLLASLRSSQAPADGSAPRVGRRGK